MNSIGQENIAAALLASSMLGLMIAIISDHLQLIRKFEGFETGRIAQSYNSAMKVMVMNRVGVVMYCILLSLYIEQINQIFNMIIGMAIVMFSTSGFLINEFFKLAQNKVPKPKHVVNEYINSEWFVIFISFIATILNLSGLTVPWVLSATFPNFRLTLSNSSFVFNTIFTLITVFYIENKLATYLDDRNGSILLFVKQLLISRIAASIMMSIGLTIGAIASANK